MAWSDDTKEILVRGMPLEEFGINNWGFRIEQAASVIHDFKNRSIPILGGDVFTLADGHLTPTYHNWYCDRKCDESREDFVERSAQAASSFIASFQSSPSNISLFVFVPDDDPA